MTTKNGNEKPFKYHVKVDKPKKVPRTTARRLKAEKERDDLQVQLTVAECKADEVDARHGEEIAELVAERDWLKRDVLEKGKRIKELTEELTQVDDALGVTKELNGGRAQAIAHALNLSGDRFKKIHDLQVENNKLVSEMNQQSDDHREEANDLRARLAQSENNRIDSTNTEDVHLTLSRFVNGASSQEVKELAMKMSMDHRCLVQTKMSLCMFYIGKLAEDFENGHFDVRNEAACKTAAAICAMPDLLFPTK